ncbi:MAG: hypothetical protein JNM00_00075, partial [Flavobacteriales bacterium]|nr:hypothetical protein [Flavobacteriales bacterium]
TDHALDARLQVDIPLCVGLGNISFTDTLSIEEDLDLAANGTLVFFIENHFPFSTTLDVDMVNENGDVLHHVLQSIGIPAALPGTNPAQTESIPVTIEANISQALLDDFVTTHSLVFHATISTGPNAEIAKLYQGQSILFSVKAMGETEINVD